MSYEKKLMEAYFRVNSIVNHQLDSFNHFITFGMQEIIDQDPIISIPGYTVKFGQIGIAPPQVIEDDRSLYPIYPVDARLRNLSYDSAIYLDITEVFEDSEKYHPRVIIGRMPIMLKSSACNLFSLSDEECVQKGECPNDPGGYFIVKGHERVLVGQLRNAYNHVFVLPQKADSKNKLMAGVRSMSESTGHSILLQALLGKDERTLTFSLPYIKEPIPVGVVFKSLGYTDPQDIIGLIGVDNKEAEKYLKYIIRDSHFCSSKEEALKYIGNYTLHIVVDNKKVDYAWQVIETECLPHLGISGTIKEQACFLGFMVRKLILTQIGHITDEDERDNYSYKRLEVAGTLMYDIFRNLIKKFINDIKEKLIKRKQRPDVISIISRIKRITKGIHQCMSTGNWGVQKNASYVRSGVSQILDRMTYLSSISHLRRAIIPTGKEGKNAAMRQIHSTSFGAICPCETPEGQKVGTVLNLSLTINITKKIPTILVRKVLDNSKYIISVEDTKISDMKNMTPVFLNGAIVGFSENPELTTTELKLYRNSGFLDKEVSISYDFIENHIRIYCDEGRFIRPLLTLTNNQLNLQTDKPKYKWSSLVKKDIIRYVDASEIEQSVIAMTPQILSSQQSDYCEIHPSLMLGIMASMIPFPDHSQSPRNCYQSSMGKQALGMPCLSYNNRTDTLLHVLYYPQKPIVTTWAANILGVNKMPSGINAIVAIACYQGFNQEDSVICNASSVDKGLFCLTSYHTIECCEKKRDTYSTEEICLPPRNSDPKIERGEPGYFKRKNANYNLLDENGIIKPRDEGNRGNATYVKKGDVLVGKVIITGDKSGTETKTDASVVVQSGEEGIIDRVHIFNTPNGYKLVKIVIRVVRIPTIGDKLASYVAQKGTIGMLFRQEDMPFTASGITPDIIMNPLAMPSRMTTNQLIACALGKECCFTGTYGDATPFTENSVDVADKMVNRMTEELKGYGYSCHGWEQMYNGMTGKPIKAKIFIGPTYYQRLKHMVDDKMHARANGHKTVLTRQPLEGPITRQLYYYTTTFKIEIFSFLFFDKK
jgi:DNA-directed RNA polymerase II subunit RPB2